LGGGYIGVEFAQIFARFGSRVTVVEMGDEIIHREDDEVIVRVRDILSAEGVDLLTGWTVKSVRRDGAGKVARIQDERGGSREVAADEIFVASGRRGNTDDLGLDVAGVDVERSWIVVDKFLQTSQPRIWACGDVHGGLQFTHVAAYEAVKLVRNMLFPGKSAVDYSDIPWTLFTDPEVAHIGMTETEARAKYGDGVRIYKTEMHDVDRAGVDRTPAGLIKLVCDTKGKILGAHILGAAASTVIEEIVLARRKGLKVSDLAQRISSYPSLADGVQKAAGLYYQDVAAGVIGKIGKKVAGWSQ
ncbi:MAG TPA: FAD-dependent oxidoreductase, partial [Thermoanaerobaculia bacterium]|nr:FAD-dependent oxidoreductase [Thermoanaerobaculia bacterium]